MKIELTVLGLLMEGNLYGYEIQKKINDRIKDCFDIKFGSIYYAIKKAIKNGWIIKTGTEKEAGNPERYVYELLPEGEKRFKDLLKKHFEKSRLHFNIDIVLMFYNSLSSEQKVHFIDDATSLVNKRLLYIKNKIKDDSSFPQNDSRIHLYEYLENHLNAELVWLNSLKK